MTYLDTGNVCYRVESAGSSFERYAQVSSALLPVLPKARDADQETEGRCQKWLELPQQQQISGAKED